jgi:4-amino-4-deoxy-L-arabinose transferase-like glycosyltransferase
MSLSLRPVLLQVALLLVLVLLTQLGNIGQEVIYDDESTFLLMASDVLDGHLPYVEYFDNKPPLFFFTLAGVMAVFGESIATFRLFGAATLFCSTVLVMLVARRWTDPASAFTGAVLTVILHAVGLGKATHPAGLAAMFLMVALWFLVVRRDRWSGLAWSGLFVGLATLTRTNLAVVAVALLLLIIAADLLRWPRTPRWAGVPFALGGLAPLGLILAIYASAGHLDAFLLSAVKVPLSYATTQVGMGDALVDHYRTILAALGRRAAVFGILVGALGACGLAALALGWRQRPPEGWSWLDTALVWTMLIAIVLSVLKSGAAYLHYWVQVLPVVALIAARSVGALRSYFYLRWSMRALVAFSLAGILILTLPRSVRVVTDLRDVTEAYTIRRTADRLKEIIRPGDRVWAAEHHLILWYLDMMPLSRVQTHPNTIIRKALMDPLIAAGFIAPDELERLYASRPEYVVFAHLPAPAYLMAPEHRARFERFIGDYEEVLSDRDILVYRLR